MSVEAKEIMLMLSTNVFAYRMLGMKEMFHGSVPNHMIKLHILKFHKGIVVAGY